MMILTEHTCTICGGPLGELGDWGDKLWCRCRNCGMTQVVDLNEPEGWEPDQEYQIGYDHTCGYRD